MKIEVIGKIIEGITQRTEEAARATRGRNGRTIGELHA